MGFNRTFMELKCIIPEGKKVAMFRFNRTFMELKSWCSTTKTGP